MSGSALEGQDGIVHWRTEASRYFPIDRGDTYTFRWSADCNWGRPDGVGESMRYTGSDDRSRVTCVMCLTAQLKIVTAQLKRVT